MHPMVLSSRQQNLRCRIPSRNGIQELKLRIQLHFNDKQEKKKKRPSAVMGTMEKNLLELKQKTTSGFCSSRKIFFQVRTKLMYHSFLYLAFQVQQLVNEACGGLNITFASAVLKQLISSSSYIRSKEEQKMQTQQLLMKQEGSHPSH